jgi:hypothetical protein
MDEPTDDGCMFIVVALAVYVILVLVIAQWYAGAV